MKNKLIIILLALLVIATGALAYLTYRLTQRPVSPEPKVEQPINTAEPEQPAKPTVEEPAAAATNPNIKVDYPKANDAIISPLIVTGQARGPWYFEAVFGAELYDHNDQLLAAGQATALSEWTTPDFVNFKAELTFDQPLTSRGYLKLSNDNPSGLPENDEFIIIPIVFANPNLSETMNVQVFFGSLTKDPQGLDCQKTYAVNRQIPATKAVARAALQELLQGPTKAEQDQGYFTSLNEDIQIQSLTIENKIAKVDFNQQLQYQVGGSCRIASIVSQITNTLKQFATIDQVIISIDGQTEDILQP